MTFRPESIVWHEETLSWEIGFKMTGFSGFFIKSTEDVLPVDLVSFKAQEFENDAVLKWETSTETAASHFDVERSKNATNFKKIGQVRPQAIAVTNRPTLLQIVLSTNRAGRYIIASGW